MLGKLIKYEVKSTARIFLPIYLVLIFFALLGNFSVNGMMSAMDGGGRLSEILSVLVIMGYAMAIFSVMVITFVVIIQRFYKNLTGDEGYLMHTLPVSAHSLIGSKLIVASLWSFGSIAMVLLSVFVLLFQPRLFGEFMEFWEEFFQMIQFGFQQFGPKFYGNILLMLLLMLTSSITGTLLIYASISIGHTFKSHRVLGSIGAFMGLSMLAQLIAGVAGSFFLATEFWSNAPEAPEMVYGLVSGVILSALAAELIFAAGWYFITHYVLTHQLNLE